MVINGQTRVKELLSFDETEVIKALVTLNRNFVKLRNPVLRKLFAGRVTIADACKIAGCAIPDFMDTLKQIGFTLDEEQNNSQSPLLSEQEIATDIDFLELDVRPLLARDKDPLKEIMANINRLTENQGLKLINTFEPIPLIHLLADKGFSSVTVRQAPNLVVTYFNRNVSKPATAHKAVKNDEANSSGLFDDTLMKFEPGHIRYLDVRSLEMPGPMLSVLAQTPHLAAGEALFVYHKKIPVHLLPELEKQGLSYVFKDISSGNVNMLIYKP